MTNLSNMSNLVDHAALQSDRWLFLAILALMLASALAFWRWIVADRQKVADRLTTITDRHIEMGEKLAEVVANNTAALRDVREVIEHCRYPGRTATPM